MTDDHMSGMAKLLGFRYLNEMSEESLGTAVMILRAIARADGVDLEDVEPESLHEEMEGYYG